MESNKQNQGKLYFMAMTVFWVVFGLIAIFYPALMNLFQTEAGIAAITIYSDHIWLHDGIDIMCISILLFALSRQPASHNMLRAAALVALLVSSAIFYSLITTAYWNMLFLVPGISCLGFAIWGFMLSTRTTQ